MNMRATRRLGVYLTLAVALSACGPKHIDADSTVWSDRTTVIGIAVVTPPPATAIKAGAQGVLDIAVNEAMAGDLHAHLKQVDLSAFQNFTTVVQAAMNERGYKTVALPAPVDIARLSKFAAPEGAASDAYDAQDFRGLASQHGIGKLLIFRLGAAGSIRSYYAFVPISAPAGYAAIDGRWIDLRDNRVLWRNAFSGPAPIQGEWDQPPGYANLDAAIEQALGAAQSGILNSLLASAPTGAKLPTPIPAKVVAYQTSASITAAAPVAPAPALAPVSVSVPVPVPVPAPARPAAAPVETAPTAPVAVAAGWVVGGSARADASAIPRLRPTPDGAPATPVALQATVAELLAVQKNTTGRWWYVRVGGVTGWLPESALQVQ